MIQDQQAVTNAIAAFKSGKFVVVVDDKHRENEADLVLAASKVTPSAINFMAGYARGLICVALLPERLAKLGLLPMVARNTARLKTAFTVSCDAATGTTTGISAYDRSRTVRALIDPKTRPADLLRPGHLFPLEAKPGGVLERAGHTEAALDLARLAGVYPAGVLCEIMAEDGRMLRAKAVLEFARRHRLPVVSIEQLTAERNMNSRGNEILRQASATGGSSRGGQDDVSRTPKVVRVAEAKLPTRFGSFRVFAYDATRDGSQHLALVHGRIGNSSPALVRLHSRCLTGDSLGSLRCDCGQQVSAALQKIGKAKAGIFLYLNQEGRGIGLSNKIKAYALQERGLDTVEANHALGFAADIRDYGVAAAILHDLGVKRVRLLTNNPRKLRGVEDNGLEIVERIPLRVAANGHNRQYLKTKRDKLGHLLT